MFLFAEKLHVFIGFIARLIPRKIADIRRYPKTNVV